MPGTGPHRGGAEGGARPADLVLHAAAARSEYPANTAGYSVLEQVFEQQLP